MPASFVAFDVLAAGGEDLRELPQSERRARLEQLLKVAAPPIHLTPMTRDRAQALEWLSRFEGAGLDGVIAKPAAGTYQPGKRAMIKVKHVRTADCVVAGFRWHKDGKDDSRRLAPPRLVRRAAAAAPRRRDVGLHHGDAPAARRSSSPRCERTRSTRIPGASGRPRRSGTTRMPGGQSRWSAGKDLSWEPLRIERVCEVKYDHMQGDRFRHAAIFQRWRADKPPADCDYDQLEVTTPYGLAKVFGAKG